ncbi:putative fungal specific transcription factor [Penicillium brasilianum]|uniref:Putative fungal specific transcription factor n=1 Tax=Penicillium brasilianum TaxID=104259 RepID=A0A1S9RRW1_PENBI|nr:putative fungal specific transcription factor [Penicillium brasilianum]
MERPEYTPGTSEIGSLTAHSNEDSQFVGSSSGVYFVNTVKRAFSTGLNGSGSPETEFPTAEDTLVGADDLPRHKKRQRLAASSADSGSSPGAGEAPLQWKYDPQVAAYLGNAPPLELAKELMMAYFKVWHPLFPFLHGPTFLQAMETLYSNAPETGTSEKITLDHRSACWTVIFQCSFHLGALLCPDVEVPPGCQIQSPGSMTALLGSLSIRHDIASLQALLAAQVFLVAKMSLRPASTFGGCILRSMLHAGLHRCPFRYAQLSSHDRQLRKRIFWCAYAIDRYLSQALGLPLGIQDSDIDVCLPAAPELHSPPQVRISNPILSTSKSTEETGHAYDGAENPTEESVTSDPPRSVSAARRDSHMEEHRKKEGVLASFVDSGTLTGRALELFHKSILVRSVSRSAVLFLVTDVHKWWNSLPVELQGKSPGAGEDPNLPLADIPFDFGPFFTILYQHLILIINRPSLSLDPSSAEFSSGLQTCIGAARAILAALRLQVDNQQAFFWPGFLSAAWMSGLVLAFACQLKQYTLGKGLQEIEECLTFLRCMSSQWETARHCHMTLSLLSTKIKQMEDDPNLAVNSHSYALGSMERAKDSLGPSNPHEKTTMRSGGQCRSRAEQVYPTDPESLQTFIYDHGGPRIPSAPVTSEHQPNSHGEESATERPSSQILEVQNMDTNNLAGGSSFDLNMGDLFEGSGFDSLLDMIGQQYPGF